MKAGRKENEDGKGNGYERTVNREDGDYFRRDERHWSVQQQGLNLMRAGFGIKVESGSVFPVPHPKIS